MNSESGYTPEDDAEGSEQTAQGGEPLRMSAFRRRLSTQKIYEMKTKLRCSREEGGPGGVRRRAGVPGQGVGTSDACYPFLQTW